MSAERCWSWQMNIRQWHLGLEKTFGPRTSSSAPSYPFSVIFSAGRSWSKHVPRLNVLKHSPPTHVQSQNVGSVGEFATFQNWQFTNQAPWLHAVVSKVWKLLSQSLFLHLSLKNSRFCVYKQVQNYKCLRGRVVWDCVHLNSKKAFLTHGGCLSTQKPESLFEG